MLLCFCSLTPLLSGWRKEVHVGVDFPYNDIWCFLLDNAKECQRSCTIPSASTTATPLTGSVTHTNTHKTQLYLKFRIGSHIIVCCFFSRRLCFLKRYITLPSPPAVRKHDRTISGFSLRECQKSSDATKQPDKQELPNE